jgi:hypothetical protein
LCHSFFPETLHIRQFRASLRYRHKNCLFLGASFCIQNTIQKTPVNTPTAFPQKPLGIKNYDHIAHLSQSRMDTSDHKCSLEEERTATVQQRDNADEIFVQEKLDGSNVGVARLGEQVL